MEERAAELLVRGRQQIRMFLTESMQRLLIADVDHTKGLCLAKT